MEEASDVARRVLESVQAVASTTACKGVQIHALHRYAIEHNLMIEVSTLGTKKMGFKSCLNGEYYACQNEKVEKYRSLSLRYTEK